MSDPNDRTTIRVGLIGASRISINAVIVPARVTEGVEVTGVAARSPSRAKWFAAEHGIIRAFSGYDLLITDPEIDLVYIGTPPGAHAALALAAIAAGKPVLVEKPFALTSEEALCVYAAAKAADVQVFEAMHSQHHRLFGRVLDIIHSGEIGQIRHVEATFDAAIDPNDPFRWDVSLGGGALMDLGVYPLAWLRRLLGEDFDVTNVEAELRSGVDARFAATLVFHGGIVGQIGCSMMASTFHARLLLIGDYGTVDVMNPVAPQNGHLLTITANGSARHETVDGPTTYEAQLAAVRDACRRSAQFPFADDDYVHSMGAIERVRAAFMPRSPRPDDAVS